MELGILFEAVIVFIGTRSNRFTFSYKILSLGIANAEWTLQVIALLKTWVEWSVSSRSNSSFLLCSFLSSVDFRSLRNHGESRNTLRLHLIVCSWSWETLITLFGQSISGSHRFGLILMLQVGHVSALNRVLSRTWRVEVVLLMLFLRCVWCSGNTESMGSLGEMDRSVVRR